MTRRLLANSPSVVEVDLGAIAKNTQQIRKLIGSEPRLYCALKCDAYGLGLVPVARTILESGGDAVSVARVGDAFALREGGIEAPILLYPSQPIDKSVVDFLSQYRVATTIWDEESLTSLLHHNEAEVEVFLKVDVGLRRLGVSPDAVAAFGDRVEKGLGLHLGGILCHPHVPPDPVPDGYLCWQFDRFRRSIDELTSSGLEVPVRMAASTAVLRLTTEMNLTAVDPGRLFFALASEGPATARFAWAQPLRALRTELIQVKDVAPDQYSSYAQIPIGEGVRVGVIPLGSSDGLLAASAEHVLIRGRPAPLFPAVSLEHARVDLSGHEDARVGDEVIVIGSQAGGRISFQQVAEYRGIPPQAVSASIGSSVRRAYV